MKNPALINYRQQQSQQRSNQGLPPEEREVRNPFDEGISRAIQSARESLGMTQKQQNKALQNSALTFAASMSEQPREKGFFKNFASVGRALNPALQTYNQEEDAALTQNNTLANQILEYQAAEQARQDKLDEQVFWRQHAGDQLAEQRRNNSLLNNFRQEKAHGSNGDHDKRELASLLDNAEKLIISSGKKAHRGWGERIITNLPGGLPLNEYQAQINALGDVLRGRLFNNWGYSNQAEFEHVPSISADNSPEVNLGIIGQLKSALLNPQAAQNLGGLPIQTRQGNPINTVTNHSGSEQGIDNTGELTSQGEARVLMRAPDGSEGMVLLHKVREKEALGAVRIDEQ